MTMRTVASLSGVLVLAGSAGVYYRHTTAHPAAPSATRGVIGVEATDLTLPAQAGRWSPEIPICGGALCTRALFVPGTCPIGSR